MAPHVTPDTSAEASAEYQLLPSNIEAEQALLGAMLVDNLAFDKVSTFVEPAHFHIPVHGKIFEAARTLIQRGQLASPITLRAMFERDESLADSGGADYLAELAAAAVSVANAEDYGRVIYDLSIRRDLIHIGQDMVSEAFDPEIQETALDQIERAEHHLFQLAETGHSETGFKAFGEALTSAILSAEAAFKREGQLSGLSSGLIDLDNLLGGLHRSDLIILAGRPSMGKTALATNIAFHVARGRATDHPEQEHKKTDDAVVGFFSLEMSAEQLATRILAEEAQLRSDHIRRGDLSADDFATKLVPASQRASTANLFIDDTPALSIPALRARARRLKRTRGLDLVVVDYLQLLRGAGKNENRVQEITEISQGLKALAKELDVPVLALSQLSRAVEQREDKRPQLSDLRESGSIEQDADVVMFIYRDEYYLSRAEPQLRADEADAKFQDRYAHWQERYERATGLADCIVAKQRHGPIGNVRLRFEAETTKFSNYAPSENLPESFG